MTKHFFKTLIIFSILIALGLVGAFLASYYGIEEESSAESTDVAN